MNDLVKRLRKLYGRIDRFEIGREAADRIEALKAWEQQAIDDGTTIETLKAQLQQARDTIATLAARDGITLLKMPACDLVLYDIGNMHNRMEAAEQALEGVRVAEGFFEALQDTLKSRCRDCETCGGNALPVYRANPTYYTCPECETEGLVWMDLNRAREELNKALGAGR